MMTLFTMATTSGWSDILYQSTSATDIDYIPKRNNAIGWTFFFILFIIIGSFFLLNLFVGVVISTYNSEKDRIGGNDLLTDKQKEWLDTRLLVLKSKPTKKLRAP